jgi:hypothetical protein
MTKQTHPQVVRLSSSSSSFFFFFLAVVGFELMLAGQALYHWSYEYSPYLL